MRWLSLFVTMLLQILIVRFSVPLLILFSDQQRSHRTDDKAGDINLGKSKGFIVSKMTRAMVQTKVRVCPARALLVRK